MQQRKFQHDDRIPKAPDNQATGRAVRFSELAVTVTEDLHAVEPDWRRLESLAKNSLHQSFHWCFAWTQSHASEIAIVEGRIDGCALFILPLEIVCEKGVRIARLPGDRFNNINTGLFASDLAMPDAEENQNLAHTLRQALCSRADLLVLDNIPLDWRGARHPLSGLAAIENQNHSFQLPLLGDFEATLGQLNAKSRRKKFRSSSRKLEALGGYDHVVANGHDEKHRLLDLFFRQKGERLLAFGLPDVFRSADVRAFFHRLADAPAEGFDTPLGIHAIRLRGAHEGHIAAIAGLSRKGDHVICQFSSIDETVCPEASPGELLFWLMIERCCREGAGLFDFGVGDQLYKRNWCTQETVQHDILLPLTWKGSLMRPLLIGVTKAKAAIKRNPQVYAIAQRFRAGHCHKAQPVDAG